MYRYLKHQEIDFELWDECIDHSENGIIYALSWYLNIACPNWDALVKIENGVYISVMPLPIKKKINYNILFNPVFCHQLGLFSIKKIILGDYNDIFKSIEKRFNYITDYHFNIANSTKSNFDANKYNVTTITSYHLLLNKNYDELFRGLSKDRKRNILKSKTYRSIIEESEDINELISLFKDNVESKIYGGVEEYQYKMISNLFTSSKNKGLSKLFLVKNESNEVIFGSLLFIYKNRIIKFFSAGNAEAKSRRSDSYFVDFLLNKYSGSHYILDFERMSSSGVNSYKESFNPQKVDYISISYNNLPVLIKVIQKARRTLIRLIN